MVSPIPEVTFVFGSDRIMKPEKAAFTEDDACMVPPDPTATKTALSIIQSHLESQQGIEAQAAMSMPDEKILKNWQELISEGLNPKTAFMLVKRALITMDLVMNPQCDDHFWSTIEAVKQIKRQAL